MLDFSTRFTAQYSVSTGVNKLWDTLKDFLLVFLRTVSLSRLHHHALASPGSTRKIRRISRCKKRAYNKVQHSCSESDLNGYKQLQKESQYECKKAFDENVSDIVTSDISSKKLYINQEQNSDSSDISPLKKDGVAHSDPRAKATILYEHLSSVFTEETPEDMPVMSESKYPDMHTFKVNQQMAGVALDCIDS